MPQLVDDAAYAELWDLVVGDRATEVLELGFAQGGSSAVLAAALDELGRGRLTTVDLAGKPPRRPEIEDTLRRCGLEGIVEVVREQSSYTWFLKRRIEERTIDGSCEPLYDVCFIDGAKSWQVDGLAFFLVDKLLRPGGTIVFDDYGYSFAEVEGDVTDGISLRSMSEDQRREPNVRAIFELLVMQHPDYGDFRVVNDRLAVARKVRGGARVLSVQTRVAPAARVVGWLSRNGAGAARRARELFGRGGPAAAAGGGGAS